MTRSKCSFTLGLMHRKHYTFAVARELKFERNWPTKNVAVEQLATKQCNLQVNYFASINGKMYAILKLS